MNILHISPYVPDVRASHAGGVCMGKTVETLKKMHRVSVLTFCNDDRERKLLKDHPDYHFVQTSRAEYVRKVLMYLHMPNMFALRKDRAFRRELCRIIEDEKIDFIHAEYTAMGQYEWVKKKYPGIRFALVEHDVSAQSYARKAADAKGAKKLYYEAELRKTRRAEEKYLRGADVVFVLNDKDHRLLKEMYGVEHVRVMHPYYGVDMNEEPEAAEKEKALCFVGQMAREENHEAAVRLAGIFAGMDAPGWKLNIIGAGPRPELKALESDRVHVTGFVEDINREIIRNQLAVFPLVHGAGIKLKVLLAFALGLPVITTHVGAEGIDPEGRVIRLAETDEEFRREIARLLEDEALRTSLSEASRAYVRERFNWEETEKVFREVYGGEDKA